MEKILKARKSRKSHKIENVKYRKTKVDSSGGFVYNNL
jgi:hypothetical protein